MTTTVPSRYSAAQIRISGVADQEVDLGVDLANGANAVTAARDAFLAAVATELDVIIIPRSELPKVERTEHGGLVAQTDAEVAAGIYPAINWTAKEARFKALGWLALAEHVEANPPIDEAQVNALADLIIEADGTESVTQKLDIRHVARRLVQAGVRAPEAGDTK